MPLSCWKERRFRRRPALHAGRHAIEIANLFPQLCPLGVDLLGFFPWPLPSTFSLWLKTKSCAFVQPPGLCAVHHSPGAWGPGGCGRVGGWYTGPEYGPLGLCWLAPGTFPFFYITLRIGGGEGTEKDVDVPVMGFGEMRTLIHVEESALLCQHKPGEM